MRLSAVLVPLVVAGVVGTSGLATGATRTGTAGPATTTTTTVAQWSMTESAHQTTMVDSSGNGNNGAISPEVRLAQPGFSGYGYGFAGDGGRVTVPSSTSLNPGASGYSVSLYFRSTVRPSSSVGDYDLIRKGLSSTSGGDWKIEVLRNGHASCHFRGTAGSVNLDGSTSVVNGAWHNIQCGTSSTGTALVVDGRTQAKTASIPGTVSNSASLMVGAKNAREDLTTGTLDEIVITKTSP